MTTQITNARRIATREQLDAARAIMADVPVGSRLTDEQQAAQTLLSQCGPACRCGDCPTTPFAIQLPGSDPVAPFATIGYVTRLDYPARTWAAIFVDHDDIMHDPLPVKRWSDPLPSFDHAEAQVWTGYRVWRRRQG